MVDRRELLVMGGAALAAIPLGARAAALPVPPGGRLAFAVVRKGSVLGHHVISFDRSGEALQVRIAVDLAVKFGPITLFRYHHRGSESWQGDTLMAIASTTDDNGTPYRVSGKREAGGFVVEGTKAGRYFAPPEALPANHWNRAMLDAPFINTQDGRLMRPKVAAVGVDTVRTASGTSIRASHFALSGDVKLDTWYDAHANWVSLGFDAPDGSRIRYELQST